MSFLQHRGIRYAGGLLLLIVIIGTAVVVRVNTTLPFLDQARIYHWLWHDGWTDLANALWEEPGFDRVYRVYDGEDYRIEAYSDERWPERVELTSAQVARYDELFGVSRFGIIAREPYGLYVDAGSADRFERTIMVTLVSPRKGYQNDAECDGQYKLEHEGSCQVALGPDWLVHYWWYLQIEVTQAKCAGIWEEYEPAGSTSDEYEGYRIGFGETERRWTIEELGERDFERWAAVGREELRLARSSGNQDEVDSVLSSCQF
ncbi:MAG: hypothetical protein AAFN78_12165 [Pseudomonadota bacterium]